MMDFEYSPRHHSTGAPHLLSPTHRHSATVENFSAIKQIRRALDRSPSKPQRYSLYTTKSTSTSPIAPTSSSALSRTHSANVATEQNTAKPKFSVKRAGPLRAGPRRTSPNSPLRRALSDNSNQANATPRLTRRSSAEQGPENVENMEIVGSEPPTEEVAGVDKPIKIDFTKPCKPFRPILQEHASPMKSSPLKRSDGVMNLEAASFGSPRSSKRRSLHGASTFGNDFNIFDQGFDGAQSDSADSGRSSDEKEREAGTSFSSTWPAPGTNSPQRRPFGLRKSTLQQRPRGSRLFPEAARESVLSPALTRARSRMSLDGALPLRSLDFESPFRRNNTTEPSVLLPPPGGQKLYQSAPKPHPLSHALTPSSSSSSMVEEHVQPSQPTAVPKMSSHTTFSKSLPVGASRPASGAQDNSQTSQESFATPAAYKMAKPLPQAFMSTGLISKRNRNMDIQPASLFASTHMPDTPSKKAAHFTISSPAPPSALGKVAQPVHEFGSPSTPFNARKSKISPESFGEGVNIFGSRVGAPQLTRRGSFLSIDGDDINNSPTQPLESQSGDELPPTPTKSTSTTIRPQSKGKSNSLRSSLFGRRTSLGPETFASPNGDEQPLVHDESSKYLLPFDTLSEESEGPLLSAFDDMAMPFITLTAAASPSPFRGRSQSLQHEQRAISPSPLARRSLRPSLLVVDTSRTFTKRFSKAPPPPNGAQDSAHSPHTPQDCFAPPDPSNLSISAEHRPSTTTFPPATPTGPREHGFGASISIGQSQTSSGYFANDVDTSLTARFAQVTISGIGEFSQVYRVEKAVGSGMSGSQQTSNSVVKVWAVKKSRRPYTGNKDRQRKRREVQVLHALRGHEHVVQLVDHWEFKNHLYIQTEFCENGNLKDFLTMTGYKGRLDDFRIWKILLELSQGVKSIHDANLIHLDLKPANVFIDWEGVLKIGDFGVASTWPAPPGLDGEGDREYIGPEVLSGRFDKPADIFALGMIMLEIAGNIVLPDNGASWQRLRAGDISDLPSLTWSSENSLIRNGSGDPVEILNGPSSDNSLDMSDQCDEDDLSFLRPAAPRAKRTQDLVQPPNFMVDATDAEALQQVVQWMIHPNPDARPTIDQLLLAGGVQWVAKRRRAGATVYEGNWGPADDVLNHEQDVEMLDM